jgi:hypothetical protein
VWPETWWTGLRIGSTNPWNARDMREA